MSAFSLLVQYRVVVTDDGQVLVDGQPTKNSRGTGLHQSSQPTQSPTEISPSADSTKQPSKLNPFGESNKQQLQLSLRKSSPGIEGGGGASTSPRAPGWSISPRVSARVANPFLTSIGDALHKKYEPPKDDDDGDVAPLPSRHDMRPIPNSTSQSHPHQNGSESIGHSAKSQNNSNSLLMSIGSSHKSSGSVGVLEHSSSSRRSSIFSAPYLLFNSLTRSNSILEQEAKNPSRTFEDDAKEGINLS